MNNFNKIPYKFLNFYTKRDWKCDHKKNLRQNTLCLEQPIYASQENCTQPLFVMVRHLEGLPLGSKNPQQTQISLELDGVGPVDNRPSTD